MARSRKDRLPTATPVRIGTARLQPNGTEWRLRAYGPTPSSPYGKAVHDDPTTGRPTSSVPVDGETIDQLSERIERWLDVGVIIGRGSAVCSTGGPNRDIITH